MRSLVWFRSDLRASDNAALHAASLASDRGIVGVFLMSPPQWLEHDWAACRVDLMMRCVRELSLQLAALNIPLLIARAGRFSDAPKVLVDLARKHECGAVFYNREYEINESRRDESFAGAATKAGIAVHSCHDQTIFDPSSIRTGQGTFYTVFTPFKKAWLKRASEAGCIRPLAGPKKQPVMDIKSDEVPRDVPGFHSAIPPTLWPAGEVHAQLRLRRFVQKHLEEYHLQRNTLATDGTSALSPYLALGAISPRQCIAAAAQANRGSLDVPQASGPSTWISEIIWREFYRHVLVGFPRVCMHRPFKIATENIRWIDDCKMFEAWCEGRTGYPIVDAGMRQLRGTGWMHNRARMITAMFLTKDLFIDWRRGERFFMQHLVDGDLANNNGGWQWSASTGTDSAPYFRIFNPASQSRANDPDGAYIRRYVPELASLDAKAIHDPPPLLRKSLGYPMPLVDHAAARERVMQSFKTMGRG
ncbi:MAG: deoxyribodipyrimidine photo-lyase [Pyrinomonadaceae bacterium]|nr:deoxyribodipyrimidine photo-lyase [Phycisphaerales bacterium]